MSARDDFQAALADLQAYKVDGLARRPAFTYSLAKNESKNRRDVRALPKVTPPAAAEGTLADAATRMADGSVSATELVQNALETIEAKDKELNAFVHVAPTASLLEEAAALDRQREAGKLRGPLHGIPVSVKDIVHVKGMPTTASSKVMAGYMPDDDATTVRLLKEAGAIVIGKTHTHEFALGVTTSQSRNPWDTTRDPGGSSGGSAISIATGMSMLSLGSDTRASIRVPASLCGIVGYKPTFGLVSTDGIVTLSWSMDHAGLQAKTAQDVAHMMNALQGLDAKDPNTLDRPNDDYTDYLHRDVRGLRVGLAVNGLQDVDPEVLEAFGRTVETLRSL